MNMKLGLWGVFSVSVCLSLVMLVLGVRRVGESVWWQRLNTKFFGANQRVMFRSSDRMNQYTAEFQWKRQANGQSALVHGIILSNGLHCTSLSSSNDPTANPTAIRNSRSSAPADCTFVSIFPSGLSVNQKLLPTSEHVRIFVLDNEGVVHPMELTDAEWTKKEKN